MHRKAHWEHVPGLDTALALALTAGYFLVKNARTG